MISSEKNNASSSTSTRSQEKLNDSIKKQKDLRDIANAIFIRKKSPATEQIETLSDSGFEIQPLVHPLIKSDSARKKPNKVLFAFFPAIGYALQTGVTGIVATNTSFYLGDADSTNMSSIAINPTRSFSYKQFMLPVIFNIWTNKNKLNFLGDWRYYRYPTYTYGLGGDTKLSDADWVNYSYIRIYQEALKHLTSNFYAGMSYNLDYHYDIHETGSTGSDFQVYNGTKTKTISSGLSLNLLYDSRKNMNYPMSALYGNLTYRSNSVFLGSDQNWQSVQLEFKKYIKLSPRSNNVLAFWNLNWFTFGDKVPYFDLPSTGWDSYSNTGRGYIQGRLRGSGMAYLESEYRFGITKNGLFGGVVFANAESVSEFQSYKFATIFPGAGAGIRIKLNKMSGANLAIDYGFGTNNSRGLFFNICEVF